MKKIITLCVFLFISYVAFSQSCEEYKGCKTQAQRAKFIATYLGLFCNIQIDIEKEFQNISEIHTIVKSQTTEIQGATIDEKIDNAIKSESEGNIIVGFIGNAHFFRMIGGTVHSANWNRKMPLVYDLPWKNTNCSDSKGLNFFCGTRENNYKIYFYKTKKID